MRSMLERQRDFTPVTASIVDRHVLARGSQEKVIDNITRKDNEENPNLILLTPTCTSSILQEDLQNFVNRASQESKSDVLLADVNHYRVNELQAADRTLEQVVRFYLEKAKRDGTLLLQKTPYPSVNIIGIFTLGFHNQHDCQELKRLFRDLNITVNQVIPENGDVTNLKSLTQAWFNLVPYREVGLMTACYLKREFNQPYISTTPMGIIDTNQCLQEIGILLDNLASIKLNRDGQPRRVETLKPSKASSTALRECPDSQVLTELSNPPKVTLKRPGYSIPSKALEEGVNTLGFQQTISNYIKKQTHFISQAAWFSRSIDCQNLTGKKTVVFGDATHAANITKILVREMGIRVSCAGTYCKHDADWFREQVTGYAEQVLITDDNTKVSELICRIEPSAIFGTQMERHIGKRLEIPCGVISAPVHIQNFPLGYRPFLGYEGTNQIADLIYNSFTLGMEDHLLEIFGGHDTKMVFTEQPNSANSNRNLKSELTLADKEEKNELTRVGSPSYAGALLPEENKLWSAEGLKELSTIPRFVRAKVKRNTEKFAQENNIERITIEVMYQAKEFNSESN